jgi:hypothetical protein
LALDSEFPVNFVDKSRRVVDSGFGDQITDASLVLAFLLVEML